MSVFVKVVCCQVEGFLPNALCICVCVCVCVCV